MKDGYVEKIVSLCEQLDNYTKVGVKKHNIAMDNLAAIYHELEKNKDYSSELYLSLMKNSDYRVQYIAAAHCLGMNINISIAQKTLGQIAKNNPDPLVRHNADMTLEVWKEQGYLNF